jgi:sensor histidine kinase YesM
MQKLCFKTAHMNYYDLIFSNRGSSRFTRHFLFWLTVFLYHFVRISFIYPSHNFSGNFLSILLGALLWGTFCNMFVSYTIVYFLIPRFYSQRKYVYFIIGIVVVFFLATFINYTSTLANQPMATAIWASQKMPSFPKASIIRTLGNPPLICGLLLSLRTIKTWYLKQKENDVLIRENTQAELQILKTQIHPHFLFNTLNNIYSFTLTQSPQAEQLMEKLTATLHYMITDCNVSLVRLENEIKMICDYVDLEKVRYGNRLQMHMQIEGDYDNKLVTPLLLIPLVENCFKHGTSKMLDAPWIKMNITVDGDNLLFELSNSKPSQIFVNGNKGIGLSNVQKRLELLYPKKHFLNLECTEDSFSVKMKLPLQNMHQ